MSRFLVVSLTLLTVLIASPALTAEGGTAPVFAEGRTGPVGLKLEVYDKKLDAKEHLFVRLTLTNLSKKEELVVSEWIYRGGKPVDQEWEQNTSLKLGRNILEIVDAKGRRVWPDPYFSKSAPLGEAPYPTQSEVDAEVARLRAEGIKDAEIPRKLDLWSFRQREDRLRERHPAVVLKPGESTRSIGWCELSAYSDLQKPATCPAEGFVELPFFSFPPGRYRVRAVRDHSPIPDLKIPVTPWDVRVATRWIDLEVGP